MKYQIKQSENLKEQMKKVFEDPQIKDFVNKAKELGYIVFEPYFHEFENMKGEKILLLKLSVSPNDDNEYTPEVYIRDGFLDDVFDVHIQTASYGALNKQEFEKFLKAQHIGMKMRNLIEDVYKNKSLPILEKI